MSSILINFSRLTAVLCCLLVYSMSLADDARPPVSSDQSSAAKKEPVPSATEIMRRCGTKNPGNDQRSRFVVLHRNEKGKVRKSEYLRVWKDFKGRDDVSDKMILFQIYPPQAKGATFMRVAYVPEKNRNVDQWIYLPVLKKIRRVTIRNPGDSFLNSNLTYADVGFRALNEDEHKLLGTREIGGVQYYIVESVPKEKNPQYSKRVFWFNKTDNWAQCANVRIDYYDTKGDLLKEQFIKWQQVNGAWIWDRVLVRNVQNGTESRFFLSGVSVNTGLEDSVFSERTLVIGPKAIPPMKSPPAEKKNDKKPDEEKK